MPQEGLEMVGPTFQFTYNLVVYKIIYKVLH
jgi:hypothetical protein